MSRSSRLSDLQGLSNGVNLVVKSFCEQQSKKIQQTIIKEDLEHLRIGIENTLGDALRVGPGENLKKIASKANVFTRQMGTILSSNVLSQAGLFSPKRNYHTFSQSQMLMVNWNNRQLKFNRFYSETAASKAATAPIDSKSAEKKAPNTLKFKQKVSKLSILVVRSLIYI